MTKTKTKTDASAPKRRRADAERSISAITNAALDALASDPDISMAEIARRAGVVRATIYMHFPTREALLDAVMEHATGAGRRRNPRSRARSRRTEGSARASAPRDLAAAEPVPRRLAININRLSAKELRRRHLPMTTQIVPLLKRGQAEGVFRNDVSAEWLIAAVRAIVHVASTELQAGRLTEIDVERTMLTTALAAVSPL